MIAKLPEPPAPLDADLRNYPYLPLDVVRLRSSTFAAQTPSEAFRAGIILWCASWHEVPAGSLPDDDRQLAYLAGYGWDIERWKRAREDGALRGFYLCNDGRLYHPVIAEKVLKALDDREMRRKQTEKARAAAQARRKRAHSISPLPPESVTEPNRKEEKRSQIKPTNLNASQPSHAGRLSQHGSKHLHATARVGLMSPDWQPSLDTVAWVRAAYPDLKLTPKIAEFRDIWLHADEKARQDVDQDWNATFKKWLRAEVGD